MKLTFAAILGVLTTHPPWYRYNTSNIPHGPLSTIPITSKSYRVSGGKVHDPQTDFGLKYENVSFTSARPDVLIQPTLRGWYIRPEGYDPKKGVDIGIVAVHGGGGDRREFLVQSAYWHRLGYAVLLYDSSDHGLSDGTGIGLGFAKREQYDAVGAARFAKQKLGWKNLIMIGTSVGASSAILAAAQEPLIDGIIAENPFYDYIPFFRKIYGDITGQGNFAGRDATKYGTFVNQILSAADYLPLETFVDGISRFTAWYIGSEGLDGPIHYVQKISPRPIFFIHGQNDNMIPHSHSELLFEKAHDPKDIWIPINGEHAHVYGHYPDEYETRLRAFVNKVVSSHGIGTAQAA